MKFPFFKKQSVQNSMNPFKRSQITVIKFAFLVSFALGFLASCEKDLVQPQSNPSLAAWGATDTIHEDVEQICGTPVQGSLVDAMGRTGTGNMFGADIYGTWELITTPSQMILQVSMGRGWFISKASIYMGGEENLPLLPNGGINHEELPFQQSIAPARNIYDAAWDKSTAMECPNTVWTVARFVVSELDFLGTPINETQLWCQGTLVDNYGAQAIGYCAESCGSTPPTPPSCTVPTPGPGDDLSAFACGNGNGQAKVTVCHIPPGNPANMQEICIAVSALPAHIIDFKPANNPCMGHHSGCHIGPCDPCGPGSTNDFAAQLVNPCPGN